MFTFIWQIILLALHITFRTKDNCKKLLYFRCKILHRSTFWNADKLADIKPYCIEITKGIISKFEENINNYYQ